MSQVIARIAHISDLHSGWFLWPSYFGKDLAEHLVRHICDQTPHLVICTGDTINGPLAPIGWRRARNLLRKLHTRLQEACGRECPIILIPGNHDLSILGIFSIKCLAIRLFRAVFSPFIPPQNFRIYPDLGLALFMFDSNPGFWISLKPSFPFVKFLTLARGEISDSTIKTFADTVAFLASGDQTGVFRNTFRIAAVHHHPLPIPYSGSDVHLVMDNAGSFLVELAKHRVDLVLHGHKHYSAFSRMVMRVDGSDYAIAVLGAGSATKVKDHEPKGNSYNLITVWSDGVVTCQQFVVRQSGSFLEADREPTVCQDIDAAGEKSFKKALEQSEWLIGHLTCPRSLVQS